MPGRPQRTRSPWEDRFLAFLRSSAPPIPEPEFNAWLVLPEDSYEIDALWLDERLAVELDSRLHDTPRARAKDARRDSVLRHNGFTILRYRSRDLTRTPKRVRDELRACLARGRGPS